MSALAAFALWMVGWWVVAGYFDWLRDHPRNSSVVPSDLQLLFQWPIWVGREVARVLWPD